MAGAEIFSLFGKIGADNDEALKKIDDTVKKAEEADRTIGDKFGQGLMNGLSRVGDGISHFVQGAGDSINSLGGTVLTIGDNFNSMAGKASSAFSTIGSGAIGVGEKLNSYITKPALAAASALAGITLGAGMKRLVGIDSAQAKLQGLGHDAQSVQSIMDNSLASVKGTAFGLDEAVTTSANAVAAGIKPGKGLERYLTLVADASAIAGSGMTEMGAIFNKIQTSGIIQGEELNQLGDRGIPIYQMLADEMGVTASEVKKLASEGKISSEVFLNAVEEGFGGAAKIMGATSFSAAFDNFFASVGRIGANFLDGDGEANSFFETVKKGLADSLSLLEPLESLGKRAGEVFGGHANRIGKQFSDFVEKFKNWDEETQVAFLKQKANYLGLAVATGPALIAIGKVLSMGGKLGTVFSKNGKAIAGFTRRVTSSRGALGKFSSLLSGIGDDGTRMNKVFSGLGNGVTGFAKGIGGALSLLSGVGSFGFIMLSIGAVVAGLGLIPDGMRDALKDTLNTVRTQAPQILENLSDTFEKKLPQVMERGTELLTDILDTVTELIPQLSEVGQTLLSGILDGMKNNGQAIFDSAVALITSLGQAFADNIGYIFELGTLFIQQLSQAIANNDSEIVAMAITLITQLTLALIEAVPQLAEAAIQIINGIINGLQENSELIKESAEVIVNALKASFEEHTGAWMAIGAFIVTKIGLGILSSMGIKLLPIAGKMVLTLVTGLLSVKGLLIAAAVALVGFFIKGIVDNWDTIKQKGGEIVERVVEGATALFGSVVELGGNLVDNVVKGVTDFGSSLVSAGEGIVANIKSGISSAWGGLVTWFNGKLSSLRNLLPFSPPKDRSSNLAGLEKNGIVGQIAKGIDRQAPLFREAMDRALAFDMPDYEADLLSKAKSVKHGLDFNQTDTADYTFGGNPVNYMITLFDLMETAVDKLDEIVRKDDGVYMDSREVSKRIDEPLNQIRTIRETRNKRFKGAY